MQDILVSVVIACFNHERFIRECILSVIAQDYRRIELVIIDDASSDNSYAIVIAVLSEGANIGRFERVRIERNERNMGAAITWNRALAYASGELCFLLNSDDAFARNRVSRFVSHSRGRRPYFGFSLIECVDDASVGAVTSLASEFRYKPMIQALSVRPLSWSLVEYNISITTGNFVFSRCLLDKIEGFANLRYCHDWEFILRVVAVVEPEMIQERLYLYRNHNANSFLGLSEVADREAAACYLSYANAALDNQPENRNCLSPFNLGPAFDSVSRSYPAFYNWLSSYYRPYRADHRTVSFNSHTAF